MKIPSQNAMELGQISQCVVFILPLAPKERGSVTVRCLPALCCRINQGPETNSLRQPGAFADVMSKALHLVSLLSDTSHPQCLLLMANEKKLQLGL